MDTTFGAIIWVCYLYDNVYPLINDSTLSYFTMKKLLICLMALLTLNSCSTFKSGLTIPANQTFLLGEYNDANYTAQLVNKSNVTVTVKSVDKNSGEVIQSFGLAPKGRTKIYIGKEETVYFENESGKDVQVDVILSKSVEGMRYIDNK